MTNTKNRIERYILPDYIVRQEVVQSKIREANEMIDSGNKHLASLEKEDIPTQLEVLKAILKTDEAFKDWLDKAEKSYIGKMGFVPKEEKERIHQSFIDVFKRTATTRNVLQGLIWNKYGYEVKQSEDGKLIFDLNKIESDATEQAKKYFTDEDKEYFDLLQEVAESYNKVKAFEKAHDYMPFTNNDAFIQNLKIGFPPNWFAFSCLIGKMSKRGKEFFEAMGDDEV